ncbi:glutathione S-transferase family protein [Nisaea acidiphila]|uniref:Glutathione S-transferase family protein n=1 Tax=Nisaea acidiphila TaxID=1862145 RepID=A0A9J7AYG2_9PROT|nr:glutathione S-transferase family protein [Nisaea acidiphila]UUX51308.1 glutathione S-transferase family protein [Nisaea acidiphila]
MPTLYHLWISPFSRKIRVILGEKKIEADLKVEQIWDRRPEFLAMNPDGTVPVFVDDDGTTVANSVAISEYLDETRPEVPLLPGDAAARAEIRRLVAWFDRKFNEEVTEMLVGEKLMKRFLGTGEPSSAAIRAGHINIATHLAYIGFLAERRNWLAGDHFSLADIAAAAHISAVDYIGDVPWEKYPEAKQWYARVKSRPSFRPLLSDHIPGVRPPAHYANLDF